MWYVVKNIIDRKGNILSSAWIEVRYASKDTASLEARLLARKYYCYVWDKRKNVWYVAEEVNGEVIEIMFSVVYVREFIRISKLRKANE